VGGRCERGVLDRRLGQRKRGLGARVSCGVDLNAEEQEYREKKAKSNRAAESRPAGKRSPMTMIIRSPSHRVRFRFLGESDKFDNMMMLYTIFSVISVSVSFLIQ
jgi:hypothetical protein